MKKILVVEDAQSLRKDILEMLGFEGYDAVGAENGLVGVEKARQEVPDLVVCDIMMPGLDGFGVLEELRRDPTTATIPFIFLTARTDRVDIRQGMGLGADDYLTKPFTASELLATVHARLEKRDIIEQITEQKMDDLRGNIILALPHELRTPLNVILGFSDLLNSDAEIMDAARIAEMARHINSSALRLFRLIENFLVYAQTELIKTDSRQMDSLRAGYLLYPQAAIVQHIEHKARSLGRLADLVLDIQDTTGLGISEEYLKKILEELMDNACKFSDVGTPIAVRAWAESDRYVIQITDHGRGMTSDQWESLGAYMQFDRRIYEQQGAGLGLIIAKRLTELHAGSLGFSSALDKGTTVTVALPIHTELLTTAWLT
jgi:two-component system sensor histidine kinase/response regulator